MRRARYEDAVAAATGAGEPCRARWSVGRRSARSGPARRGRRRLRDAVAEVAPWTARPQTVIQSSRSASARGRRPPRAVGAARRHAGRAASSRRTAACLARARWRPGAPGGGIRSAGHGDGAALDCAEVGAGGLAAAAARRIELRGDRRDGAWPSSRPRPSSATAARRALADCDAGAARRAPSCAPAMTLAPDATHLPSPHAAARNAPPSVAARGTPHRSPAATAARRRSARSDLAPPRAAASLEPPRERRRRVPRAPRAVGRAPPRRTAVALDAVRPAARGRDRPTRARQHRPPRASAPRRRLRHRATSSSGGADASSQRAPSRRGHAEGSGGQAARLSSVRRSRSRSVSILDARHDALAPPSPIPGSSLADLTVPNRVLLALLVTGSCAQAKRYGAGMAVSEIGLVVRDPLRQREDPRRIAAHPSRRARG